MTIKHKNKSEDDFSLTSLWFRALGTTSPCSTTFSQKSNMDSAVSMLSWFEGMVLSAGKRWSTALEASKCIWNSFTDSVKYWLGHINSLCTCLPRWKVEERIAYTISPTTSSFYSFFIFISQPNFSKELLMLFSLPSHFSTNFNWKLRCLNNQLNTIICVHSAIVCVG